MSLALGHKPPLSVLPKQRPDEGSVGLGDLSDETVHDRTIDNGLLHGQEDSLEAEAVFKEPHPPGGASSCDCSVTMPVVELFRSAWMEIPPWPRRHIDGGSPWLVTLSSGGSIGPGGAVAAAVRRWSCSWEKSKVEVGGTHGTLEGCPGSNDLSSRERLKLFRTFQQSSVPFKSWPDKPPLPGCFLRAPMVQNVREGSAGKDPLDFHDHALTLVDTDCAGVAGHSTTGMTMVRGEFSGWMSVVIK